MRYFVLLACCLAIVGCDPSAFAAIQVAPQPTASPDSGVERAFAIVARIAERQGLSPGSGEKKNDQGWVTCYARSTLFVCAKRRAAEAQFQMRQTPRFSDIALQLKNELLDALRREFGEARVRECKWTDQRDLPSSGCPPIQPAAAAARDSG